MKSKILYSIYIFIYKRIVHCSQPESEFLKEAMRFRQTFNGKVQQNDLKPLLFRNKCINWYNRCKKIKGFIPEHAILRLKNAMIEDADEILNQRTENEITTIKLFLKWFDESFNVTSLRKELFKRLTHWKIDKTTPRIKIVDEFQYYVRLFDQSGVIATSILK